MTMGTRRINVTKVPFNFKWPNASVVTVIRDVGEALVKNEVADAAVAKGYAKELDPPAPKKATTTAKTAKPKANAANKGQPAGVDRADLAPNDSTGGIDPVADAE